MTHRANPAEIEEACREFDRSLASVHRQVAHIKGASWNPPYAFSKSVPAALAELRHDLPHIHFAKFLRLAGDRCGGLPRCGA